MAETTLVGVRVHSWQWFKFRKWADSQGLLPGDALSSAVHEFLALQSIPQSSLDSWLAEFHSQESRSEMD